MTREALWKFLLSLSVVIPALIGLFKLKKVERSYYPFLVYLFVSLANELFVGLYLVNQEKKYNILNWQVFNLFEALILYLQFYFWLRFDRYRSLSMLIFALILAGWLVESFVFSSIFAFNPVFIISYSFLLVLLSVQAINQVILKQSTTPLHKNAMFIICVAMVLYFIYNIFVFTLQGKGISKTNTQLMSQVFGIRVYVNAFTNLLYGLAVYYLPSRMSSTHFFRKNSENDEELTT